MLKFDFVVAVLLNDDRNLNSGDEVLSTTVRLTLPGLNVWKCLAY